MSLSDEILGDLQTEVHPITRAVRHHELALDETGAELISPVSIVLTAHQRPIAIADRIAMYERREPLEEEFDDLDDMDTDDDTVWSPHEERTQLLLAEANTRRSARILKRTEEEKQADREKLVKIAEQVDALRQAGDLPPPKKTE